MPVVLRVDGFAFKFYSGDHDPPHVHVRYGGTGAVIDIATGHVRSSAMRQPDLARACALVRDHRDALLSAWLAWKLNREGTA
ncbi:MAG TPA: DUF4160 domain-containing protein [Longimicrobium sp.]|nr:DUF4160 domain-containing protein [Longimicrobium sp.]